MLFSALMATFMSFTYAADSISINFTHNGFGVTTDATGELGGVGAAGWNNVTAGNTGGTTVKNQNGVDAGTISISNVANSWQSNVNSDGSVTGIVQDGYIDVPNSREQIYTLTVNHNYWLADVTFYMSADTADKQYAPIKVNGTAYIGGTNQTGESGWGSTGNPAGVTEYNDTNSINVTGLAGPSIVAQNVYPDGNTRATLAGMQIKDSSENHGYFAQLGTGSNAAAEQTWSHKGTEVAYADIAAGNKYIGVYADAAGSTISFAEGETLDSFAALSNSVTLSSDGALTVNDIYTAAGAEAVIDTRVDVTTVHNNGSLEITDNGVLAFKNSSAANAIMTATGSGVIETYKDTVLQGTARRNDSSLPHTTSAFEGTISVKGGTLIVGDNSQWNGYWGINLSSIKSIDLDGGNMKLFCADSDLSVINVKQNSAMNIWEATVVNGRGIVVKELVLDANLTSHATWDSTLNISKLSGTGNLTFTKERGYNVTIDSVDGCGIITNGVTMNLGADATSAINLSKEIENTGTLNVNGVITISDDLSGFTLVKEGELGGFSVNGTDGYQTTTGSTYLLIDNNGGTVTVAPETALYQGNTIDLTQDTETGDVTFVGGSSMDAIYRVNTVDITIGGDNATAGTERATGVIVAEGRTVTIAGNNGNTSAADMLLNTSGKGTVKLTTDASLGAGQATQAQGKLTISGSTLSLSGGNDNSGSIASFSAVELDNANIYFNNNKDTFHNLTVTSNGGSIELYDMGDDTKALTFAGTTTLNGTLTLSSTWNSQLYIEQLSGSGNLVIDDSTRSEGLIINIAGGSNYTGQVQVKQSYGNLSMNVAENAGVNVAYTSIAGRELNLQNIKAGNTVTLSGVTGFLTKSSVITADVELYNTSGANAKAAVEINDGYDWETNRFTGSVSGTGNFLINKDTTAVHMTYQFEGDVSGWTGQMEVVGGEHDVVYTDKNIAADKEIVVNNSLIRARDTKDDNGNSVTTGGANVTFDYSRAATVKSAIVNDGSRSLNLTVKNSSEAGTTFTSGTINVTGLTVGDSTKASFVGLENLAMASLNMNEASSISIGAQSTGTLSATSVRLAGGATINGNLDLSNTTTLTLNTTADSPVSITGMLVMEMGAGLTLEGNVRDAITGLKSGEKLDLFSVGGFTLGVAALVDTQTVTNQEFAMSTVFAGQWEDDLYLGYDGLMVYVSNNAPIPEPATATLSLLALAALAARRRRR